MLPLWVRIAVTVLSAPSLVLCTLTGVLCLVLPLGKNEDGADFTGMPVVGIFVLANASQAAVSIWCGWRKRVTTGTRVLLLLLSIGAGVVAAAHSVFANIAAAHSTLARSDPYMRVIEAILWSTVLAGLAVSLLRSSSPLPRAAEQPSPKDLMWRTQHREGIR